MLDVGRNFRFLKEGLRFIIENLPNPIELIKDLIGVVEEEIVAIIKALVEDPEEFFLILIEAVIMNVRMLVHDVIEFGRFVITASAGKIYYSYFSMYSENSPSLRSCYNYINSRYSQNSKYRPYPILFDDLSLTHTHTHTHSLSLSLSLSP